MSGTPPRSKQSTATDTRAALRLAGWLGLADNGAFQSESAGVPLSLSMHRVADLLGDAAAHFSLECVDECASTNDLLSARAPSEYALQLVLARSQTAGRGRRGRVWLSPESQGLTFSCAWQLPADAPPPSGLSLLVGLALAEAMEALGARGVALKWPNDVLCGGEKLAGILVELVSGQQRAKRAIIGIGLNLRATPDALPAGATALQQHVDVMPADEEVLAMVLKHLHARLIDFSQGGFAAVRPAWQSRDAFAGRPVRICSESSESTGICDGVADDGALLLREASHTRRILSGEVSLRAQA